VKLRSRIDLNLLAVFDAVYWRGSVTQAAQHLNLSQSAISHALARLRREFDDQLFVRSGRGLVPTALSHSIIEPVRSALVGLEQAITAATRFDVATSDRSFRIGLRPATEAQLFADLAARVRAKAPDVRLASVNFRRRDIERILAENALDMIIDVPSEGSRNLHSTALRTDTLVVVARHGHPLVDGAIDVECYARAKHIIASPRPSGFGAEDSALAALGRERDVVVRAQHAAAAWRIVAESDMLLTLPQSHAEAMRSLVDLQILPLPLYVPRRSLRLSWHAAAERDPGNQWLRGIVVALFLQHER
jgi:DNA-binding transcriptional LysR family regulator